MGRIVLLLTFLCAAAHGAPSISLSPSDTVNWRTTVEVTCTYDAKPIMAPDFSINGVAVLNQNSPYYDAASDDADTSILFVHSLEDGQSVMTLTDVDSTNSGEFSCSVYRDGSSQSVSLTVVEPPSYTVTDISATPDYTSAAVTFTGSDDATKYLCEYKTSGEDAWTAVEEVTDAACTLTGLSPATTYSVRVQAGNVAGYRDDISIGEGSFTTGDNRPPVMLDSLDIDSEYNSTILKVSWGLGRNAELGIKIESIVLEVSSGDDSQMVTLGGDVTSHEMQMTSFGEYTVEVAARNNFTVDEEPISKTYELEVATEEPTEPEVPVEPEDDKEDIKPSSGLICGADAKDGYTSKTQASGSLLHVECKISEESTEEAGSIEFTYDQGDAALMGEDKLTENPNVSVAVTGKSKTLTISALSPDHEGDISCSLGDEKCFFKISIAEETKDQTGDGSRPSLSALVLSLVIALIGQLQV